MSLIIKKLINESRIPGHQFEVQIGLNNDIILSILKHRILDDDEYTTIFSLHSDNSCFCQSAICCDYKELCIYPDCNNIVEFDDYISQNPDIEELIIIKLEEELFKCL